MTEDDTFNVLKYKRYAACETRIGKEWIAPFTTYWVNDAGELHREDGPAVETADGTKEWWLNGTLTRKDGPTVIWANGTQAWYRDHRLHREDGPALEHTSGLKVWYIDGEEIPEAQFSDKIEIYFRKIGNNSQSQNKD